jgi:hypothetical protein
MKTDVDLTTNNRIIRPDKTILQPGEVGATIEWFVSNTRTGEILQHQLPKRSESYTKQFLQILYAYMNCSGVRFSTDWKVKCSDGVEYMLYQTTDFLNCAGAVNTDISSIVVGTGNTAPTITDYALQTKIAHGSTAGKLQYSAVTFGAPASDATTSQFTVTRNFANASGGSITVNEIGLYVTQYTHTVYPLMGQYPFAVYPMILRDVIGGGIAVPNGQTLTVNYRPQAVV